MEEVKTNTNRRHYDKPHLEKVQLMTEEAVLSGCKFPSGGIGPGKNNCKMATGPNDCLSQGS